MDRTEFLGKYARPNVERVELSGGDAVYVRAVAVGDMRMIRETQDESRQGALLIAKGLCDEHGERALLDADAEAFVAFMPPGVFDRLLRAALRVNYLDPETFAEQKKSSTTQ